MPWDDRDQRRLFQLIKLGRNLTEAKREFPGSDATTVSRHFRIGEQLLTREVESIYQTQPSGKTALEEILDALRSRDSESASQYIYGITRGLVEHDFIAYRRSLGKNAPSDLHTKAVLSAISQVERGLDWLVGIEGGVPWGPARREIPTLRGNEVDWPVTHEVANVWEVWRDGPKLLRSLEEHFPHLGEAVQRLVSTGRTWESKKAAGMPVDEVRKHWGEQTADLIGQLSTIRLRGSLPDGSTCHICSDVGTPPASQ